MRPNDRVGLLVQEGGGVYNSAESVAEKGEFEIVNFYGVLSECTVLVHIWELLSVGVLR